MNAKYKAVFTRPRTYVGVISALLAGFFWISCGGSSGGGSAVFTGVARVTGQAYQPVSDGVSNQRVPLRNAPVTLVQFLREAPARELRSEATPAGVTDDEGFFDVTFEGQPVVAIVVRGSVDGQEFRSSGLVQPDRAEVTKDFNGATDVACEALVTAINEGDVDSEGVRQENINNLEAAALRIITTTNVDFTNPASVTAASRATAALTNNGQTPPPPAGEIPSQEDCRTGLFTCADGTFRICAENVCNGAVDCPDGSDESPDTCGTQSACCTASAGCPGETATSCSAECCCCPLNEICDQENFAAGCVAARTSRTLVDEDSPLSKLVETGTYY